MTTHPYRDPLTGLVRQLETPAQMKPSLDRDGFLIGWVPDYSLPGVAERVDREVEATEAAAHPPRSNIGLLLAATRAARFERKMAEEYGSKS